MYMVYVGTMVHGTDLPLIMSLGSKNVMTPGLYYFVTTIRLKVLCDSISSYKCQRGFYRHIQRANDPLL